MDTLNRLYEVSGTLAGLIAVADGYHPEKAEIADVLADIAHAAESARRAVLEAANALPAQGLLVTQ